MTEKKIHHEKYDSPNPIAQKLLNGFINSITQLSQHIQTPITSVTECGCGQGHVNRHLEHLFPAAVIKGFDLNPEDVSIASDHKMSESTQLYTKNIYDTDANELADLIVCCEVLEHLDEPGRALQIMAALKADHYLFSVPNEPIWRILNFMRGKYIKDWGNTPDHRNHWSTRAFVNFVSQELNVTEVLKPLPWTMVLAQPK